MHAIYTWHPSYFTWNACFTGHCSRKPQTKPIMCTPKLWSGTPGLPTKDICTKVPIVPRPNQPTPQKRKRTNKDTRTGTYQAATFLPFILDATRRRRTTPRATSSSSLWPPNSLLRFQGPPPCDPRFSPPTIYPEAPPPSSNPSRKPPPSPVATVLIWAGRIDPGKRCCPSWSWEWFLIVLREER